MDRLLGNIADFQDARKGGGDSFTDRINCRYTVFMLAMFSLALLTRQYVGTPISCWCPAHFTGSHEDFANTVCWTTDTYYLSYNQLRIPKEDEPQAMIGYYQWVPLILALQAFLFFLPRLLWTVLSKWSGMAVSTITDAAIECQAQSQPEERQKIIQYMTNHMGRFLLTEMKSCSWHGMYLNIIYIGIKFLYLGNAIGQLFMLNKFLGFDDYHLYGITVLEKLVTGQDWRTSDRFPRVTLCDVYVRVLGNLQRYTIQCSLPMNLFNEIIFIFVWFWIAFAMCVTACSVTRWLFLILWSSHKEKYMRTQLLIMQSFNTDTITTTHISEKNVRKFLGNFLRGDGYLIIQLVSQNTSRIIAAELSYSLWKYYQNNRTNIEQFWEDSLQGPRFSFEPGLLNNNAGKRGPAGASNCGSPTDGTELKYRSPAVSPQNSVDPTAPPLLDKSLPMEP